jgi:hypothetical protein
MVVIDEHDLGKSRKEILMDLIYEGTGRRIPLDKVSFGKPRALDQRPEISVDANTFIPARIDPAWDARLNSNKSGFMYRRHHIKNYCDTCTFMAVKPLQFPFKVSELLDQINDQLPYPLFMDDFVDKEYLTLESTLEGIDLIAQRDSLLWHGRFKISIDLSWIDGNSLVTVAFLDGFNVYENP